MPSDETHVSPLNYEPKYSFTFDDFLKREYRFGLDPNRPTCKAFLQGHCPLGNLCKDKHYSASAYNSLVCKHWMRGLCKKGEACEFLHEYNLRRMPECNNWTRHGACPNGDDCTYQHLSPSSKRPPCPHYDRGFCPLGPVCANKHVKRSRICPFYLAGFCPDGKECRNGAHARFPTSLKKPKVAGEETVEDEEEEGEVEEGEVNGEDEERSGGKWQRAWQHKKKRGGGFKGRRG